MDLLNGRKKNVDLKGYTVFCILCKIMSVVNFVSCNLNEYIKEITLKGWSNIIKNILLSMEFSSKVR